jgi:hypothetical protein
MERLHAISRELEQGHRRRSALRRLARSVLRAIGDIARSRQAVRHWGSAVQRVHKVPLYRQFLQLSSLAAKYRFTAEDYYRYRMYRSSRAEVVNFFPLRSNIAVREFLYERLGLDPTPLADKRVFYRRCLVAGLPVPPTVADFERGEVRWWNHTTLPTGNLFVKEAASLCGAGAALWRFEPLAGGWTCGDGPIFDAQALTNRLTESSWEVTLILQHCIPNHPELAGLAPSGLCTARIVTLVEPGNSVPALLVAAFRMPAKGEVADNFARGGVACPVDLDTGVLSRGVHKDIASAHLDVPCHPGTGAVIEGRRLPLWREAVALALRAHRAFPAFPSVGWDIAITPDGPMLIEGNYNWDVVLAQQTGPRPLGSTAFPVHLLSWLTKAAELGKSKPPLGGYGKLSD